MAGRCRSRHWSRAPSGSGRAAREPGEFTQRAYLNDKLDLAQAEAVADLIDAGSEAAARAAFRSLQGEFSTRVHALDEALAQLRAHVEATIDFPTDEIDLLGEDTLLARLAGVRAQCAALQAAARQGRLLTEGLTVVIAGAPNAGKSTLLNRLAGHDAAIVSEQPGTTRDVLREHIQIEGVPVLLLDTAGLRQSADAIESEGMRRARSAMAQADRVLFMIDAAADPRAAGYAAEKAQLPAGVPVTLVYNKVDLLPPGSGIGAAVAGEAVLKLSALQGTGLDALRAHLLETAGYPARKFRHPVGAQPAPRGAGRGGGMPGGGGRAVSRRTRRGTGRRGAAQRAARARGDHRRRYGR